MLFVLILFGKGDIGEIDSLTAGEIARWKEVGSDVVPLEQD